MNETVLKDAMIRRSDKLAYAAYQYFMILLGIDEKEAEEQFLWDSVLLEQLLDAAIEILKKDGFSVCNPRVIMEEKETRLCNLEDCGCSVCPYVDKFFEKKCIMEN